MTQYLTLVGDKPVSLVSKREPIAVGLEYYIGGGWFNRCDALELSGTITAGINTNAIATAQLTVGIANSFDNTDADGIKDWQVTHIGLTNHAHNLFLGGKRIWIGTYRAGQNICLFNGVITACNYQVSALADNNTRTCKITAQSIIRAGNDTDLKCYGQLLPSGRAIKYLSNNDTSPEKANELIWVDALPLTFNPDNRPNCRKLKYTVKDYTTGGSKTVNFYTFAPAQDVPDENVGYWNQARVLRYLQVFAGLPWSWNTLYSDPDYDVPNNWNRLVDINAYGVQPWTQYRLGYGNLNDLVSDVVDLWDDEATIWDSDIRRLRLRTRPINLSLQGMGCLDAFAFISESAGLAMSVENEFVGNNPVTYLYWHVPGYLNYVAPSNTGSTSSVSTINTGNTIGVDYQITDGYLQTQTLDSGGTAGASQGSVSYSGGGGSGSAGPEPTTGGDPGPVQQNKYSGTITRLDLHVPADNFQMRVSTAGPLTDYVDVTSLDLNIDESNTYNRVVTYGGTQIWEGTFELIPGWPKREEYDAWDNVQSEDALIDNAENAMELGSDDWFKNRHITGEAIDNDPVNLTFFNTWVLNEDGAFDSDRYWRPLVQGRTRWTKDSKQWLAYDWQNTAKYLPLLYAQQKNWLNGAAANRYWSRRPRRFRPLFIHANNQIEDFEVEISWYTLGDEPVWIKVPCAFVVMQNRAGIILKYDDPRTFVAEEGARNWFEACVKRTARVRVHCCIEGDEVSHSFYNTQNGALKTNRCWAINREADYPSLLRMKWMTDDPDFAERHLPIANSTLPLDPPTGRNFRPFPGDSRTVVREFKNQYNIQDQRAYNYQAILDLSKRNTIGSFTVPWLDYKPNPQQAKYLFGTEIMGINNGISADYISLEQYQLNGWERYPSVVKKEYVFDNARATQETRVTLDDANWDAVRVEYQQAMATYRPRLAEFGNPAEATW